MILNGLSHLSAHALETALDILDLKLHTCMRKKINATSNYHIIIISFLTYPVAYCNTVRKWIRFLQCQ